MGASIHFVTPEEHQAVVQEVSELRALVTDLLDSLGDEVDTATALRLTGLHSRSSLIAERTRPGTPLKFCKHGRSVSYSRTSCLAYKRQKTIRRAA